MRDNEFIEYGRHSTQSQIYSIEQQTKLLDEYYEGNRQRLELPVLSEHRFMDRSVSGAREFTERPEGKALLAYVKRGDHVAVCYLDRLGRDLQDIINTVERFYKLGVTVHCPSFEMLRVFNPGDPMVMLVLHVMAAIAQFYRGDISVKTRNAMRAHETMGYAMGRPKYRYKRVPNPEYETDKTKHKMLLVYDHGEAGLIDELYIRWKKGESMAALLRWMEGAGKLRAEGDAWTYAELRKCLMQEEAARAAANRQQQKLRPLPGQKELPFDTNKADKLRTGTV